MVGFATFRRYFGDCLGRRKSRNTSSIEHSSTLGEQRSQNDDDDDDDDSEEVEADPDVRATTILSIYHEKQHLYLCGVHSLNNLLQEQHFSRRDFNQLSEQLWVSNPLNVINRGDVWPLARLFQRNPHKSPLGIGLYDENVLLAALKQVGVSGVRFDRRTRPSEESLDLDHVLGLIVNVKAVRRGIIGVRFGSSHWFCIRKINGQFYNLDSKLSSPLRFEDTNRLIRFLMEMLACRDGEIIKVYASSSSLNVTLPESSHHRQQIAKRMLFSKSPPPPQQQQPRLEAGEIIANTTVRDRSRSEKLGNSPTLRKNGYIATRTSSPTLNTFSSNLINRTSTSEDHRNYADDDDEEEEDISENDHRMIPEPA